MKRIIPIALLLPLLFCGWQLRSVEENVQTNKCDSITPIPKRTITLLFAGDLMQHQSQIDAAKTATGYDYSDCFKYLTNEIATADVAIGNLEVTLGGKPYAGYPMFSAPDEYLYAIKDAGFNILLTANNHCMDRGKAGLERTIDKLDSLSLGYLGTYVNPEARLKQYPYLIEQNGFRIALLNYTYDTNGINVISPNVVNYIDKELIEVDIEKAKSMKPDAIIANMHWGEEYISLPSKKQKELADWLLSKGVDHIIGGHPHVIQPMELRKNNLNGQDNIVVYSLGNVISNMSKRGTDGGALFKMTLEKDSTVRVADCGYSLVWTDRPIISGRKDYILYPMNCTTDSLNESSRNKLNIFKKDSKELLEANNVGIKEYFLY